MAAPDDTTRDDTLDLHKALTAAVIAMGHVSQLMMTGTLTLPTALIEELGDAMEAGNKALARGEGRTDA